MGDLHAADLTIACCKGHVKGTELRDNPIIDDQLHTLLSPYQASDWSVGLDLSSDWLNISPQTRAVNSSHTILCHKTTALI